MKFISIEIQQQQLGVKQSTNLNIARFLPSFIMNSFENSFGSQFYSQIEKQQPCFGLTIPQKEFRRSENNTGPHFGVSNNKPKLNIKQFQFQQKIVMLKIELKVQSIIDILQPKVQNIKRTVINNLKTLQNPQQTTSMQQSLSIQIIEQVANKINSFVKRQHIKLLSKGLTQIILRNVLISKLETSYKGKKKVGEKRCSQMLRMNSQLNQNSLHVSDLMADGEGSHYSSTQNPKLKNKELKVQKQKMERNRNFYLSELDKVLSQHQQFLKKK